MSTSIDENFLRITTVLSPFSGLDKVDPEILAKAARRGNIVHSICDAMIESIGYDDLGVEGYIGSFKHWFPGKEFIDKPKRWYCHDLMITGECDALYKNETGLTLVDFKTPVKASKTWFLQASAYHYLGSKNALNITEIEFVRLKKDGKPPQIYKYEPKFEEFRKCLDVYRMFFENREYEETLDYL